jgi:hypothetical protein
MSRLSPPASAALALAAASALIALAGVTAASAAPAASPPSDPVIVEGVLYDTDGSRAAAGELVTLTAWPTSEVLAGLADGEPVPTLSAGVATTDAAGGFELSYSDPEALAAYADTDGTVDFTVESLAGGVLRSYGVSRVVAVSQGAAVRSGVTAAPADATAAEPVSLVVSPDARQASASSRTDVVAAPAACTWVKVKTLGPRWVQVGEGYTTTGVSAKLTYAAGSSSTLGVGFSTSGSVGSFTMSGTTTVSSSATIGMSPISAVAGRYWKTQFVYSKFGYACGGASTYGAYEVRATSFAGGAQNISVTAVPSVPYCTPMPANTSYTKASTNASTFSAGAALAKDIGINLSARTGFTTTTKITYTFAAAHKLCGSAGYPGDSPGRLAARP